MRKSRTRNINGKRDNSIRVISALVNPFKKYLGCGDSAPILLEGEIKKINKNEQPQIQSITTYNFNKGLNSKANIIDPPALNIEVSTNESIHSENASEIEESLKICYSEINEETDQNVITLDEYTISPSSIYTPFNTTYTEENLSKTELIENYESLLLFMQKRFWKYPFIQKREYDKLISYFKLAESEEYDYKLTFPDFLQISKISLLKMRNNEWFNDEVSIRDYKIIYLAFL